MGNCVLWGNSGGQIAYSVDNGLSVSNSLVQGGWPGTGSLNVDPQFFNAADPTALTTGGSPMTTALRVSSAGGAYEMGNSGLLPAEGGRLGRRREHDRVGADHVRGKPRVSGSQLDIGVYEGFAGDGDLRPRHAWHEDRRRDLSNRCQKEATPRRRRCRCSRGGPSADGTLFLRNVWAARAITAQYTAVFTAGSICHVKVGGTGSGATWAEATGDFQGAIEAIHAAGGGQVWVAEGTYKPTSWPNGGTAEREKHFSLRGGVAVCGGFPATGDPGMAQRSPWVDHSFR